MYDLNRIRHEFRRACLQAKVPVRSLEDIKINGRLTSTHGRVTSQWMPEVGGYFPVKVEFSKQMLDYATDESIRQVILHEAAHYIATYRTHADHGHDSYFKAICREIGCTASKASGNLEYKTAAAPEILYKYLVVCPNCGVIGGYQRKCRTLNNINYCSCKKCGSNHLKVVAN